MTWFHWDPSDFVMSVLYLMGIALMLPVLLLYCIGCSIGCLVTVIAGKLLPERLYPEAELS
ncbi:MAG: hypothetical protein QNJ46_01970 [Leptolyngbyaceae cyanobacterium MO_188.B28]|nr:hypothetical protein [Leptolyngbyaceae cyanobacterium MO_188.B28]